MSLHPNTKEYVKKQSQLRSVLYFALMSTVFVFGFVVFTQGGQLGNSASDKYGLSKSDIVYSEDGKNQYGDLDRIQNSNPEDPTTLIFGFVALIFASMSFLLPNIIEKSFKFAEVKPENLKAHLLAQTHQKTGQKLFKKEDLQHIEQIPDKEKFIYILAPKLFIINLLQWVFSESVATIGVVVGLQNGFNSFIPFGVSALVLFLIHRPDGKSLERKAAKMARQYWR